MTLKRKIPEALFITAFFTISLCLIQTGAEGQDRGSVREPILAGSWYPAAPEELTKAVRGYLSSAESIDAGGELRGLIVPHAGYMYSGHVAAHAYRLLEGKGFRRVILIGPSHRMRFRGVSVDLSSGYRTPLGVMPVDRDFGKRLVENTPSVAWISQAHEKEHCLEIQVPFLQIVLPGASIVPLVMGEQDPGTCQALASALVREIGSDPKTLILASTDLSHYHTDAAARMLDNEFIRLVGQIDPQGLSRAVMEGKCEACGAGPAVAALLSCKGLGADHAVQLKYANSGDVTGDRKQVVGYLSAALLRDTGFSKIN